MLLQFLGELKVEALMDFDSSCTLSDVIVDSVVEVVVLLAVNVSTPALRRAHFAEPSLAGSIAEVHFTMDFFRHIQ